MLGGFVVVDGQLDLYRIVIFGSGPVIKGMSSWPAGPPGQDRVRLNRDL